MPQNFAGRQVVDVSGAFDNCFFHAYAAHLLANQLPLPEGLFTFDSLLGAGSPASQIQKKFPDERSLSLFAEYAQQTGKDFKSDPDFLVEKTLILGSILREFFAVHLLSHAEKRSSDVALAFGIYSALENAQEGAALQSEMGALYQSNRDFLEYCRHRPKLPESEQQRDALPSAVRHFERYFQNNISADGQINQQKVFADYWKEEGCTHYCSFIAQQQAKVSAWDVMPVLTSLQQPLAIITPDGSVSSNQVVSTTPPMEVVIKDDEGHYYLVANEVTSAKLRQYEESYRQYRIDREEVLHLDTQDSAMRFAVAQSRQSLLVEAICPPDTVDANPFDLLIAKINQMSSVVDYARRFETFKSFIANDMDSVLSTENKKDALVHYHRELEPIIDQWLKFPSTSAQDQATLTEYKRLYEDIEQQLASTANLPLHGKGSELHRNPFPVFCAALTRDLDLVLVAEDKKAALVDYHQRLEPIINTWISWPQISAKDKELLIEYKDIFQDIERAVDQHSQEDVLRSQLQCKLDELAAYSSWLEETAQSPVSVKRTLLSNIDVHSEMKIIQGTMARIHDVLSVSVLDQDKASSILHDSIKANHVANYKKRYGDELMVSRSCVREATEVDESLSLPSVNRPASP